MIKRRELIENKRIASLRKEQRKNEREIRTSMRASGEYDEG